MAFQKILCPIDFSPISKRAMAAAARLAIDHDAELVVLHAWFLPPVAFSGEFMYSPELVQEISDAARRGLDAAVADATQLGVKRVRARLGSGAPWLAIVDEIKAESPDLVVLGTHGRTGIGRVLLGSVAEAVVRHASCPVLAIRGDGALRPFKHVLCPVDFSPQSRSAAQLAVRLVQPGGAGLTLVHVLEPPVAWGEPRPFDVDRELSRHAALQLGALARELATLTGVAVSSRITVGSPGAQLLAALDDDHTIDLVVMGSHGRTGLARLALGSVAEKLVRHAHCSVLVNHDRG